MDNQDQKERQVAFRGADPRFTDAHLGTQCVRASENWEASEYCSAVTPIHNANVYYYENVQDLDDMVNHVKPGYGYARWGTPTNTTLERLLSTLEGAEATLVGASGMAAIHTALLAAGLEQNSTVVCSYDMYGPSFAMLGQIFAKLGVRVQMADFGDLEGLKAVLARSKPKVVYFEVMTNPLVKVVDAPAIIELAHSSGATVVVDNTFLTPYIYRPIPDGADYVCHSVSKYLSGHGDVMAGSVSTSGRRLEDLHYYMATLGGTLASNSAWLAIRGIKTFHLRMERHCSNALRLAEFLQDHPQTANVRYPGLPSHPQHELAKRLFRPDSFGGMLSFELVDGDKDKVYRFIDSLNFIVPGGSLGEVHTLILNPARTTHHNLSPEELAAAGIKPGTIRLSVGLEDVRDLEQDLDRALSKVG